MLLRFEDVIEGQPFAGFAGTEPDGKLGSVAAQAIESYDLCQSGFHFPPTFGVDVLAQASDPQSLLEGLLLIFAEEDVDRQLNGVTNPCRKLTDNSRQPAGFPNSGIVCGSKSCENDAQVWLKANEEQLYQNE